MWIVPSGIRSAYVAASGCSSSQSPLDASTSESTVALRLHASGTLTLRPSSYKGWKTRHWSRALFGAVICETSTPSRFAEWWTSSLRGSRASRTASQESNSATATNEATATTETDLSLNSCESCLSVAPPWCSSKTCLTGFAEDGFDLSERNYADWVTRSKTRSLSLRNRLARVIGGNGCLCWPTARSEDSESCGNHPNATDSLTGATKMWSSPTGAAGGSTSRGWDRIDEPLLGGQAANWATPNAHDGRRPGVDDKSTQAGNLQRDAAMWLTPSASEDAAGKPGAKMQAMLTHQAVLSSLPAPETTGETSPRTSGRRLNPAFVCTLMGVPWFWTRAEPISFAAREMRSFRFALLLRLSILCEGLES